MKAGQKTLAHILNYPKKLKNVDLAKLAKERGLYIDSFRLKDGSFAKLLTNEREIDCVILRNGDILTAKGKFYKNAEEADYLYRNILKRLMDKMSETISKIM